MTAQSIVCGACAGAVPGGRLSCPSCGELLASVAGSRRATTAVASRMAVPSDRRDPRAPRDLEAELPWSDPPTNDGLADAVDGSLATDADVGVDRTSPPTAPWAPHGRRSGSATPAYLPRPTRRQQPAAPAAGEPDPWAASSDAGRDSAALAASNGVAPTPFESVPFGAGAQVAAFAGPGAYVPPLPVTAVPAGPPAPAREYAGHPAEEDDGGPARRSKRRSSDLLDGDARTRLLDFARWLSVAGSSFAAVGFLLPWGLVVIGSNDVTYFGRWGIAGPWHIVMVMAVLANLGLALVDNGVPTWLRTGICGLGLGALLLGLVWPYITIPALGTGPGAIIAGIGAAALVVSGLLALVTDRRTEAPRPV